MPHSRNKLIFPLLFLLAALPAFGQPVYPMLETIYEELPEGEQGKCLSVTLTHPQHDYYSAPALLKPYLNCQSKISQSVEEPVGGRYLAWHAPPKIMLYDFATQQASTLMSLFEDGKGISEIQWEDNGDGNDTTELVFLSLNPERYKYGVKLFHLAIAEGKLIQKIGVEIPAAYICNPQECKAMGFSFYDGQIEYWSGIAADVEMGMKVRKFYFPGEIKGREVRAAGNSDWWSVAEHYYTQVLGEDGLPVPLPEAVSKPIAKYNKAAISPDQQVLVYSDGSYICGYNFGTKKAEKWVPVVGEFSQLQFSPDGKKVAWVAARNETSPGRDNYLQVVWQAEGKMEKHTEQEIPIREIYDFEFEDSQNIIFARNPKLSTQLPCSDYHCTIHLED